MKFKSKEAAERKRKRNIYIEGERHCNVFVCVYCACVRVRA